MHGSVAEEVLRHAAVSVLTCRDPRVPRAEEAEGGETARVGQKHAERPSQQAAEPA